MHLRPIQLEVRRSVVIDFKRLAKEVFPLEAFAYLLGRDAGDLIEIEDLFIPNDLVDWVTPTSVSISDLWLPAAKKQAKEGGLKVVGDIHSHAYKHYELGKMKPGCVPSAIDMEEGMQTVTGICDVLEGKTGKLRSDIRFWGPMFPVRTWIKK